jgi:mRNA-degrading endonuclease toxin of MazEF toxin-antitoxin module
VLLPAHATGPDDDSVANVSQISSIDRGLLSERVGALSTRELQRILAGINIVLGR